MLWTKSNHYTKIFHQYEYAHTNVLAFKSFIHDNFGSNTLSFMKGKFLYSQKISMGKQLRPPHRKNDKFIQCTLDIFKSAYIIELYTNFTRRDHCRNKVFLIVILSKVLLR